MSRLPINARDIETLSPEDIPDIRGAELNVLLRRITSKLDRFEASHKHEVLYKGSEENKQEDLDIYLDRYRDYKEEQYNGYFEPEYEKAVIGSLCDILDEKGIEYETEVHMFSDIRSETSNPRIDVLINNSIGIECKSENSTRKIQKAIGQCSFYRYAGYSPCILVPHRRNKQPYHKEIMRNNKITYCELNRIDELDVIHGEGITGLFMENIFP